MEFLCIESTISFSMCNQIASSHATQSKGNFPFNQISFGGIKDPHILTGHSMTYVGAQAGLFTNILINAKQLDSVVLLDEIDKIPNSIEGHSISSVLLHVLDKTQNNKFCDMYLPEVPINLSHIFFILALNDEELLDPRYHCVCVEQTDYRPILFEDVIKRIEVEGGSVGFKNGNGPTM